MESRHSDPTTTKPMAKKTKAKTTSVSSPPAPPAKPKAKVKPQRAKPEPMPPHVLAEMVAIVSGAMARQGWTAYRLAKVAQVDGATVHRFLKNKRPVSLATFARFLDALGIALQGIERKRPAN